MRCRWRARSTDAEAATRIPRSTASRTIPAARQTRRTVPMTSMAAAGLPLLAMLASRTSAPPVAAAGAVAPKAIRAPTAASPQPRPSACQSRIATAGERRGHEAAARALAAGIQPTAIVARITTAADTTSPSGSPAERSQCPQQCLGLGAGHAVREPRERGLPVAGLVQRAQHELGHVCFPAFCRTIVPCPAIALPPGEALLGKAVEHRHHSCVCQVPISEQAAHLANAQRVGGLPEHIHYGALELPKSVHPPILTRTNQAQGQRAAGLAGVPRLAGCGSGPVPLTCVCDRAKDRCQRRPCHPDGPWGPARHAGLATGFTSLPRDAGPAWRLHPAGRRLACCRRARAGRARR